MEHTRLSVRDILDGQFYAEEIREGSLFLAGETVETLIFKISKQQEFVKVHFAGILLVVDSQVIVIDYHNYCVYKVQARRWSLEQALNPTLQSAPKKRLYQVTDKQHSLLLSRPL